MTQPELEQFKRRAAHESLQYIKPGATLGIGTGSTVRYLIEALTTLDTTIAHIVSSSKATTQALSAAGFTVSSLNHVDQLDLYIDGADEIDPHGRLLKGGGGAHAHEKILAFAAKQFVCIADQSKVVKRLGKHSAVAVEVLPEARSLIARKLVALGGQPVWREDFITDHGNDILDVRGLKLLDPVEWAIRIKQLPGVVDHGIFVDHTPHFALIGSKQGVQTLTF